MLYFQAIGWVVVVKLLLAFYMLWCMTKLSLQKVTPLFLAAKFISVSKFQENFICTKEEDLDDGDGDGDAAAVFDQGDDDLLDVHVKSENDVAADYVSPFRTFLVPSLSTNCHFPAS